MAFQLFNQFHGCGFDTYRQPGTGLPTTVGQYVAVQVAAAHVGDVDKRNAAQHEEQHEKEAGTFHTVGQRARLLQLTESLLVERTLHRDACTGVDSFEQPRTEGSKAFVDGTVVDCAKHAHVRGNRIPIEHLLQQVVLESL